MLRSQWAFNIFFGLTKCLTGSTNERGKFYYFCFFLPRRASGFYRAGAPSVRGAGPTVLPRDSFSDLFPLQHAAGHIPSTSTQTEANFPSISSASCRVKLNNQCLFAELDLGEENLQQIAKGHEIPILSSSVNHSILSQQGIRTQNPHLVTLLITSSFYSPYCVPGTVLSIFQTFLHLHLPAILGCCKVGAFIFPTIQM